MTQEDKDLLLKDISARFPYGVKLHIPSFSDTPQLLQKISDYGTVIINDYTSPISIDKVKPYLRPRSSMTEEEIKIYQSLQDTACSYHYEFGDIVYDFLYFDNDVSLDYLNSIHIDYRGLIEKGLALKATKDMYNIETKSI